MSKMKVKTKEVRTVVEGEVTGGVVTLDYSQVSSAAPESIGINAVCGESNLYGSYYAPNRSFNINVNGYTDSTSKVIDEIFKMCVDVAEGKAVISEK